MADYEVGNIELKIATFANGALSSLTKANNLLTRTQKALEKMQGINIEATTGAFANLATAIKPFTNEVNSAGPGLKSLATTLKNIKSLEPFTKQSQSLSLVSSQLDKQKESLKIINAQATSVNNIYAKAKLNNETTNASHKEAIALQNQMNVSAQALLKTGNLSKSQVISLNNKLDSTATKVAKIKMSAEATATSIALTKQKNTLSQIYAKSASISSLYGKSKIDAKNKNVYYEKSDKIYQNMVKSANKLKVSNQLSKSETIKLNNKLGTTKTQLDKINVTSTKTSKIFSKMFSIASFYVILNVAKRLSQGLAKAMKSAIDFTETLNKFQVAMGDNYKDGLKFVNGLASQFNLATQSIMDFQASFMNMLNSIGNQDSAISYKLSETLTRLSLDFASLFNVSVDRAMNAFQTVLAGQIKTIRSAGGSGMDVTESQIGAIYKEIGGTKNIRQLGQLNKRYLRIIALEKQMIKAGAVGDFAKTLSTPANELKRINETFEEAHRWLGTILLKDFEPLIKKGLIFVNVIKELLKSFAIASGFELQDFGTSDGNKLMTGLVDKTNEYTTATDEATDATKKLMGLFAFDKFEALNSASTAGGLTADQDTALILESVFKYSDDIAEMGNHVNEITESIMKFLGYTKQVTEDTGDIVYVVDDGISKITVLKGLLVGIMALAIPNMIFKSMIMLKKLTGVLGLTNKALGLTKTLSAGALMLAVYSLFKLIDAFNKGSTSGKILYGTLLALTTAVFVLMNVSKLTGIVLGLGAGLESFNMISITSTGLIGLLKQQFVDLRFAMGIVVDQLNILILKMIDLVSTAITSLISSLTSLVTLVWKGVVQAFISLRAAVVGLATDLWGLVTVHAVLLSTMGLLVGSVAILMFMDKMNSTTKIVVGTVWALVGAIVALKTAGNVAWGATTLASIAAMGAGLVVVSKGITEKVAPKQYANGGMPDVGEMFVARESGPEMVGSMGGKSAVANNDQIVQGISDGVYRAVMQANSDSGNGNTMTLVVDGKNLNNSYFGKAVKEVLTKSSVRKGGR